MSSDGLLDNNNGYGLNTNERFTYQWQPFTAPTTTINPPLYFISLDGTKNLITRKLRTSYSMNEMAPGFVNLQTVQFENIKMVINDMRDVLVLTLVDHQNSN